MQFKFPAAVTATKLFRVHGRAEIPIEFYSATWNSATIKLTVDRTGTGTYHDFAPSTDPTDPLTGDTVTVGADLSTVLTLGSGHYGVVVTGTPTDPIKFHLAHRNLSADENGPTYYG
jgi:hypothetical protein